MSAEPPRLTPFGEIARSGDPDRFAAALFARDETTRERLFTLIAFNLEIARIPWLVSEPQLGAIRLAWWRERLAAGDGGGGADADADAARAPLAAALHELMAETGLDPELLGAMIDAREADLAEDAPPDRDAVDAYVTGTAARLLQAAAWVAAAPETPPETRHEIDLTARDAGWAQGAAALLRAAPELAARGRCVLPLAPADRAALAAGDTTPAARRAAGAIAEAALARLAAARARRRGLPRAVRRAVLAAFLPVWRAEATLAAARRPDLDLLRDLGPISEFRRRAGLLWRGATGRW